MTAFHIPGNRLVPAFGTEVSSWYWCGLLPLPPLLSVDVAGINFPDRVEAVDVDSPGTTTGVPKLGCVVRLSTEQVRVFAEKIALCIVRFGHQGAQRRLTARVLRLAPSEPQKRRGRGEPPPEVYNKQAADRPLADFLYMVRVDSSSLHDVQEPYPAPLSRAGLELPGAYLEEEEQS